MDVRDGLPRDVWNIADAVVSAIDNEMWAHPEEGRQISWGAARMAVGMALLAERESATLAERERWQIPPSPTFMGFPLRFDPNMAPGETRIEDKDGNVIGKIVNAAP